MKKHKIDDLFAGKLTEWEPKASSEIWQKIEAKQESKPRRLGGFWYAAASVAVLLLAGYFGWQSLNTESIGKNERVAQAERKRVEKLPQLPEIQSTSTEELASTEGPAPDEKTEQVPTRRKAERGVSNRSTSAPKPIQVPILEKIEIAKIDREAESTEDFNTRDKMGESLRSIEVAPAVTGDLAQNLPEDRVIVAHVDTDDLTSESSKSSKFIRILRQLKNVKQGEEVDWQEVGFNPKKLLARADDQLRNEEAKVARKYQELKEKTKL